MFPENRSGKVHFFFDEIQLVEGWEKYVRRLMDAENVQVYVSGSSAKMLSREIASSMRGRTVEAAIYPYSYREFLKAQNIDIPRSHLKINKQMQRGSKGTSKGTCIKGDVRAERAQVKLGTSWSSCQRRNEVCGHL